MAACQWKNFPFFLDQLSHELLPCRLDLFAPNPGIPEVQVFWLICLWRSGPIPWIMMKTDPSSDSVVSKYFGSSQQTLRSKIHYPHQDGLAGLPK